MRRGPKPAKSKVEAKPPVGRKSPRDDARVRDLEKRLAEALQREAEAVKRAAETQEQQTATADILRIISTSPTDLQPVLDAVSENAARLCEAYDAILFQLDAGRLRMAAHHGSIPAQLRAGETGEITRGTVRGRAFLERRPIHVADLQNETEEFPQGSAGARKLGHRTILSVPLLREGVAIGVINLRRNKVAPFSDKQIELLQTFADQAVIAIENVRLFTELQEKNRALTQAHGQVTEALEQQTATSEILSVISSSPTDVQPVFDAIVRNAGRLCEAASAALNIVEGDVQRKVAEFGPESFVLRIGETRPIMRTSLTGRAMLEGHTIHIGDIRDPDTMREYPDFRYPPGTRACLATPLLREGSPPVGALFIFRRDGGPFTERHAALLKTFADQAVIAIENVRLFNETKEALEQQTATSEILNVISRSPTDVQPVLDTVVEHASRLCSARDAQIFRREDAVLRLVAHHGPIPTGGVGEFTMPTTRGTVNGRAVIEQRPIVVADLRAESMEFPEGSAISRNLGHRAVLSVPLMREGIAIGTLSVRRAEVLAFTDVQMALLQTFADQAVIAIENVRLFTELQEKNRALTQAHAQVTEALEQQTATSQILAVISGSPTDVQPVFQAIATNAARLCAANDAVIFRREGDVLRLVARWGSLPMVMTLESGLPIARDTVAGRAVTDAQVLHIPDVQAVLDEFTGAKRYMGQSGIRTALAAPLLREGVALGLILIRRLEVKPFTEKQIDLLKTFADQAVIAIENVRLFTELQASNRDLTTALDTQTATSDILRVISQSQTDVQPVFDAIVTSAVRLLRAHSATLSRVDGEQIRLAAVTGIDRGSAAADALRAAFEYQSVHAEGGPHALAIRDRVPVNIADTCTDPRLHDTGHAYARARGVHGAVAVPLLRRDEAIGAITVARGEPGEFTDDEIALLKTFADQAVIAIENARLLTELQARTQELSRSVGELQALGEVGRAVSSSLDLETVLTTIVSRAVELSGLDGGVVFEYDEVAEEFVQRAQTETGGALADARRTNRIRKGEGVLGRTAITLESVQVPDITVAGAYAGRLRENLIESGIRAILAVPMIYEGRLIGCLGVTRNHPGDFPSGTIELLRTFATQSALAMQNARLFREIEEKSHQLELASQHKSEFLANMSHELRTPLNAIIGFSEVLAEKMFGELNEKQEEYSKDIHASGQHLLSLINDILDLSKIEAGRMELELTDFHLPTALDSALTLVRERAGRRAIALQMNVDNQLGQIQADERKVRQVVLNLLSNAIKFTPEGGRIEVAAAPRDGSVEVSVSDTGVGIAPEDQEAVFEEFRQVGTADKKVEGTGLGLTLCRKFVELHGGRIWVTSEVGVGSTFTFTLPVLRGD